MTITELPRRTDDFGEHQVRWSPSRAGILNVWRYYDEVFEFHDGRLLLRGPNGSGKSKALELLLPFLFDASLRPNRLSTFGTSERTMHWNMMGEGASGVTRVGYVWLEFRLPGVEESWFTCGARLQATAHTTSVHPDYFTTDLRVGVDLALTNDAGQPLTRAGLEQALDMRGRVHAGASDYREQVRTALFPTLTEQRYDALIMALLQLRTPKLSQRLDPSLLSVLLSRALPPLGQDEIEDLAEGFERLDAQRERLQRLQDEVTATRTLARQQRTYAQRVLRARAAALVSATTELEKLSGEARASAEEYESVARRKSESEARVIELEAEHDETDARKDGLMDSEAYKQGLELDGLRTATAKEQRRAFGLRTQAVRYRAEAEQDTAESNRAAEIEQRHARAVSDHAAETRQAALRVGMAGIYEEIAAALGDGRTRALLRGAVRGKRDQIDAVVRALEDHERSVALRRDAECSLDTARQGYDHAVDRQVEAAVSREEVLRELRIRLLDWAGSCRQLTLDAPDELADRAESETAVAELIHGAVRTVLDEITRSETHVESAVEVAREEREQFVTERDRLSAEHDIPPAAPSWRTTDRTRMVGAPLWRLVDFAEDIPESARAAIEAALEASGLLDAWLGPRGEIVGHDVFADPAALTSVAGRSLADVLSVEPVDGVDPAHVRKLLLAIGFGDRIAAASIESGAPIAAIGADGSWRMGALTGSWNKDHAAHIGASTRLCARERRIQVLDDLIERYDDTLTRLAAERQALTARRDVIRAEVDARPGYTEFTAAQLRLTRAESDLAAADSVVRARLGEAEVKEAAVKSALLELSRLAAETGLPSEREALTRFGTAVDGFGDHAETWLDAHREWKSAQDTAALLTGKAGRSTALAQDRESEAATSEAEHRQLAAKLATVESAIGLDYRDVLDQIRTVRTRLGSIADELRSRRIEVGDLTGELGRLDSKRGTDTQARDAAAADRDALARSFRHVATGVFPIDGDLPELDRFRTVLAGSEGVRAALDAARLVAAAWPAIPHSTANLGEALRRLNDSIHESRTALSSRADLDLETDDDIQIFTAVIDGVRVGAAELLNILSTDAQEAEHEITDRERDLFDKTLTGDTRRHLAARIRQANDLVDGMNARLERVRTASNVAVRLVWQIAENLPPGTKAARDLLLKDPVRLTDADHEALHRFLRDRIEEAKADDTATSWEQQLAQVFDYTAWHQFVVKVDRGKGEGYQKLTKKLHGALSGGEKAIALHLPLFAAVAAHYQTAPQAPRLILLDEVFVGVDTTNRGQIFALLSDLDLDLVLTSDHEWCTYAELSGIGIHQIITGDGDDAVTTARFTWDGQELLEA
ncbi:TIGR02680 family protein [Nocardia sp. SYP-A9097]|uniref:TIGR02680 family protein n=1 Tax=Nocardia sp. SYP-A9097 TaxID=2663237 RepID=UPI001324EC6B|nr:TIGR02680 family protein [Nocardia sp. SYP-A9097]MRH92792.1 TIGR02680 family protein [Nocardia sp. SYP-A9097]